MTSSKYLDCELYLSAADQARLTAAGREYTGRPDLDEDLERRLLATIEPTDYGTLLFEALLPATDGELLAGYREALVIATENARRLRFRLHVANTAPSRLHGLQWELLYDPQRRLALGRSREIAFSRYSSVPVPQPAAVDEPKLLVVVACPENLTDYHLDALDEDQIHASLEQSLSQLGGSMDWEFLEPPATLSRVRERLTIGGFHALHFHAHGLHHQDHDIAHLVLEDDARQAAFVDEALFAEIFEGHRELRLVTLIACHGGRPTNTDPFSGLGPTLVHQEVAAVIAMQRAISVDAANRFNEHFYGTLARDGHVDAAVAEARLHLHLADPKSAEWGTPALFMRLSNARLWNPAADEDPRLSTAAIELARARARDDSIDTQELVHSETGSLPLPVVAHDPPPAPRRRILRASALTVVLLVILAAGWSGRWWHYDLGLNESPRVAVLGMRSVPTAPSEPWQVLAAEELLAFDLETMDLDWVPAPSWIAEAQIDDLPHSTAAESKTRLSIEHGVNVVLSGHLTPKAGDHVRLTVRLSNIENDRSVGLSSVGDASELLEMTADLANRVAATLRLAAPFGDEEPDRSEPATPKARQLYDQALAALRVLDAPAAEADLSEAIRLDPEHPGLHAALADAHSLLGNAGEAERQTQHALIKAEARPRGERLKLHALHLETRGEWARAAAVLKTLCTNRVESASTNHETILRVARLLIRSGTQEQIDESIEILRHLEGPATNDLRILLLQTEAALARSEWERQLELTRRVIAGSEAHGTPLVLARARELRAVALRRLGRLDEAQEQTRAARDLYSAHGHRGGEAEAWNTLGSIQWDRQDVTAAKSSFETASTLFEDLGRVRMAASIQANLSLIFADLGELDNAIDGYRKALGILTGTGNPTQEAGTLINLAVSLSELGRLPEATTTLLAVEELVSEIEPVWEAFARRMFAAHFLRLGRLGDVGPELEQAMTIAENLGDPWAVAETLLLQADLRKFRGELSAARALYLQALEIFDQSEEARPYSSPALRGIAEVDLLTGDLESARRHYERIVEIEESTSILPPEVAHNRVLEVRLLLEEADLTAAEGAAAGAVRIFEQRRAVLDESSARNLLARVFLAGDRLGEARQQVDRSRDLLSDLETPVYRLPVDVTAARILIARGADDKARHLSQHVLKAATVNERFSQWEYEARVTLGELDLRTGGTERLVAVEKETRQKGFILIADRAARLLRQSADIP